MFLNDQSKQFEWSRNSSTRKIESGLLRLHAGSPYESLSSLSRYGRGKGRGKRGMGERTSERRDGREDRDQNTVQLTHVPAGPPRSPAGVIWRYRSRVRGRCACGMVRGPA